MATAVAYSVVAAIEGIIRNGRCSAADLIRSRHIAKVTPIRLEERITLFLVSITILYPFPHVLVRTT